MEVDLQVHTNKQDVYFDGGHIWIKYDTSVFNPNIVNSGFFNASFCPEFQNGSYIFYGINNETANTMDVLGGLSYSYPMQRILLDTVPKPFIHLAFAVSLDSVTHGVVFFADTALYGNPTYANTPDAGFSNYYSFNHIYVQSSDTFIVINNKNPIILEMDNLNKIAGVGDTLSIRGLNFGNIKGEVFFRTADDGGQSYLRGLDDQYHIFWSDTAIKVLVPSIVYKGYENLNQIWSGGAGSGMVKIQTLNGDTNVNNLSNDISVKYSVTNHKSECLIRRVYLARQHCDYDYQFTLHQSLENDTDKITVIDSALRLWSRLTGLTLQLERDTNGDLVFENLENVNGKNIISLVPSLDKGVMNTTKSLLGYINSAHDTILFRNTGSNIRILQEPTNCPWAYYWFGSVADNLSFYQAFLHEIGHILLLEHVNNEAEVMYYVVKKNTYIIVPDTGSWAVKGVLANIEASRNINWSANLGLYPIGVRQPQILVAGDNPPYICNGEPITLQSNYPDDQLAWSTGATTSAITVQQAGQYTLSLTDHGCTLYDTLFVGTSSLQANLVTVDADCPNHANGSITANVTGDHSPYTYQWNGNGMAPANTSQITNLSPGTYSLTVTDDAGCQIQLEESVSFDTETLQVCIPGYYGCPATLAPLGDYGCRNPIFAVVSGGETPYQYGWYVGDGGNSSLPNHVVYISTVDYVCPNNIPPRKSLYLLVQDACGQSKVVEITSIMLNGVSDDPVEVKLRPNPATNHVEVSLDVEGQIDIVEVYDVCGKLLQTARGGSQTVSLSVSALASGLYFVRVKSDAGEVVRTLVKR